MSDASSKKPTADSQQPTASFGGPVRVVLVGFGIFLASQFLAIFIVEAILTSLQGVQTDLLQSAAAQFLYILLSEAAAVGAVLWVLKRRGLKLPAIGLGRLPAWRDLKWAVGGFLAFFGLLFVALTLITFLISGFDVDAPQDVGFNVLTTSTDRIIAFAALVIIPPLGEEVLMRGYLYSGLRSRLRFWPALLLTSVLFGAAHLTTGIDGALWAAGVSTFVLSAVLVYLRERTGALYAPIMVHTANNLVAFLVQFS